MLTLLVPMLAILAAPSPAPSPTASTPSALKEIGHVESLSVCTAIVVHANSAISVALENDGDLALTINRLRTTDLDDDNPVKQRNGMNDLETLASRIRIASATGNGEIKRLRAMAAQTTEPTRKAELKAFADALGGAIARQNREANELDRALVIIDGRRAVEDINTTELTDARASMAEDPRTSNVMGYEPGVLRNPAAPTTASRVDDQLRSMAEDFNERAKAIAIDEGTAADHALGATTGC